MIKDGISTQAHEPAKSSIATDERVGRGAPPADGATERVIQLVSRWAGIIAFVAALVGVAVLIF